MEIDPVIELICARWARLERYQAEKEARSMRARIAAGKRRAAERRATGMTTVTAKAA